MDISGWRVILEECASRLFESDVSCIITQVKLLEESKLPVVAGCLGQLEGGVLTGLWRSVAGVGMGE